MIDEVIECVAERLDVDDAAGNKTSDILVTHGDAELLGSSKGAVAAWCDFS